METGYICPACQLRVPAVSDHREQGVMFREPICADCRTKVIRELSMNAFDVAYERARVNGWED